MLRVFHILHEFSDLADRWSSAFSVPSTRVILVSIIFGESGQLVDIHQLRAHLAFFHLFLLESVGFESVCVQIFTSGLRLVFVTSWVRLTPGTIIFQIYARFLRYTKFTRGFPHSLSFQTFFLHCSNFIFNYHFDF